MVTRISGICAGVLLSLLVSVFIFPRSASQVGTPPSCDVFRSGFCAYTLPQPASSVVPMHGLRQSMLLQHAASNHHP